MSSVSLNSAQTHFAVGCGAQIEIGRLIHDSLEFSNMQLKSSGRFTITDVAFSPNDDNHIAASATNGMVGVFDLNHFVQPNRCHTHDPEPLAFQRELRKDKSRRQGRQIQGTGSEVQIGNQVNPE